MGPSVEGFGMIGCIRQYIRDFLQGSVAGGPNLWVGDLGDATTHREDTGRV